MIRHAYVLFFCVLLSNCTKSNVISSVAPGTPAAVVTRAFSLINPKITIKPVTAVTVINQGVPGNTAEMLLTRINTVISEKPDLVIIMIGTNDVLDGDNTYYNFGSTLSVIIDSLKHIGSSVMLLTPPPVEPWSFINMNDARLDSLCIMVKNLSVAKSCYFVDINNDLAQVITAANSQQLFIYDGLHPSGLGYADIASYIAGYMRAQNIDPGKIVCFGDSITNGYLITGAGTITGETYPAYLSSFLNEMN